MTRFAPPARRQIQIVLVGSISCLIAACVFAKDWAYQDDPGQTPPGVDYKSPAVIPAPELGGTGALRFALFGDWGMPTQVHRLVSDGLFTLKETLGRQEKPLTAVFLAGDNFYPKGVSGLDDPKWEALWGGPFRRLAIPFYVSLGNHDYGEGPRNAQLQVEKSGTPGFELWKMRDENGPDEPGIAFSEWFRSEAFAVQAIFVDTNLLMNNELRRQRRWASHLHWLAQRLDEAPPKADGGPADGRPIEGGPARKVLRFVVGHHLPACFGEKAGEVEFLNAPENKVGPGGTSFADILRAKATAYLSGHAHTLQYIALNGDVVIPKEGPIHGLVRKLDGPAPLEIISGTAGEVRQNANWGPSSYYTARLPGFTLLVVTMKEQRPTLLVYFVDCRHDRLPKLIYGLEMPLEKAPTKQPH